MNEEMADVIQRAFGPCTGLYETMTLEEIVEEYREGEYKSPEDFIQCQLDVEDVCSERTLDAAQYSERTDVSKVKTEMKAFRADILRRLKEAGFEKEFN